MSHHLDEAEIKRIAHADVKHIEQHLVWSISGTVDLRSVTWPMARPTVQLGEGAAALVIRFDCSFDLWWRESSLSVDYLSEDDLARGIMKPIANVKEWRIPEHPMRIVLNRVNHSRENFDQWMAEAHLAVFHYLQQEEIKGIIVQDLIKRDPKWV